MSRLLEAEEASLLYRTGGVDLFAVQGISLALRAGEFLGLMGPSGSGKSSLLYLLSGLKRPTAGRILWRGQDLASLGHAGLARLRRHHFGFIFQQHFLLGYLTALENCLVGAAAPDVAARARGRYLLDRMGLAGQEGRYPHQLSGGQRQRVAAARSLMNRPDIVFADEPTASLDHKAGIALIALLEEYRRDEGCTLLVVTHDPAMLAGAGRVAHMFDGRITRISGETQARSP